MEAVWFVIALALLAFAVRYLMEDRRERSPAPLHPPAHEPSPANADPADAARDYALLKWRDGFSDEAEVLELVREMLADEYADIDVDAVAEQALEEAITAHQVEQMGWPEPTDCDRLDAAFAALNERGIVARQNFSCCQNCGHAEIGAEVEEASAERPIHGYTFFHQQDTESAAAGGGLYLAYGDETDESESKIAVGHEIVDALRETGLDVDWNGELSRRIHVSMTWQRRRA